MKYKVGDRVRIIDNYNIDFDIGEIVTIGDIDEDATYCFYCKNENNCDWVRLNSIAPLDYTWEDFLKCRVGTKVTFENENILCKVNEESNSFRNGHIFRDYDDLENFRDNFRNMCLGKIIKIEEPTYITVYNQKEVEEVKEMTKAELQKVIDKMAEDLTTPIHNKEWIINHYYREIE